MEGLVSIPEFIAFLKTEGYVLIKADAIEERKVIQLREIRSQYMKSKALTFKQVLDAQLLPLTSKQGIESWIDRGVIKEGEVMRPEKGQRKILTSAIRRLGYTD